MNTKKFFKLGALLVVLTLVLSVAAFAQTTYYVNGTNGDDALFNGRSATVDGGGVGPYRTIGKAITSAASGDIIRVAADTYGEATVTVTNKALTFIGISNVANNALTTVNITNGLTINASGDATARTVYLGRSSDGSLVFNLGTTATALTLTSGALEVTGTNLVIGSGGTITRTGGTLTGVPTTTNVNVTYGGAGTTAITAGDEIPASLGSGILTINKTGAASSLSFANAITTTGGITISGTNVAGLTFSGDLTLSTSALSIAGSGAVTITGNISTTIGNITHAGSAAVTIGGNISVAGTAADISSILLTSTGAMTINGSVTWTYNSGSSNETVGTPTDVVIGKSGTGNLTFAGTVSFVKSTTGAANPTGTIQNNNATGTLALQQGFTVTSATISSTTYRSNIAARNEAAGTLTFGGAVEVRGTLINDAAGTINLAGGTVYGDVTNGNAAGTINLNASTTIASTGGTAVTNAGVFKLNTNTLTFSGAAPTLAGAGNYISATASTIGSGTVVVTGGTVTVAAGGELPNVTVSSAGGITFGAARNIYGNLTLASSGTGTVAVVSYTITVRGNVVQDGGTLSFTSGTLDIKGNFTRTGGTFTRGTGTVSFTGVAGQTFNPGASLRLYNLTYNAASQTLTLGATVEAENNVTLTAGTLALGANNLRMVGTTAGTLTNTGGYTSTGGGYIIFEGGNTAGANATITGGGVFSNIDIRSNTNVELGSSITVSGEIVIREGFLDVLNNTLTMNSTLVRPGIQRAMGGTDGAPTAGLISKDGTGVGGADGTGVLTVTTDYNLTFFGTLAANRALAGGTLNLEYTQATKIYNLTISTTGAFSITTPASAQTVAGALTVSAGATFNLNANTMTLSNNSASHSVAGTVANGTLNVTGTGATLNGSTVTADAATIDNLTFAATAAGSSFTVNNVKAITTNLSVAPTSTGTTTTITNLGSVGGNFSVNTSGTVTATMNTTSAVITGNVVVAGGATVTLNMAATTSTHGGALTLTSGNLTYTRGSTAAQQVIGGAVTLTAGSLTLGTSVTVAGTTTLTGATLALGSFNYTAQGDFTRNGTGTVTATTGQYIANPPAATDRTYTFNASSQFVNFTMNGQAVSGEVTFAGAGLEVTGAFVHTEGIVELATFNLTLSGSTYTFNAAAAAPYTATSGALIVTGSAVTFGGNGSPTIQNLTINSTGTVTVNPTSATPAVARTITVSTLFTHTAGAVALGINHLSLTGAGAAYTRAAGTYTASTGEVRFFGGAAQTFTPGSGLSIPNLSITNTGGAVTNSTPTVAFTVTTSLTLSGAGALTTNAGTLTLGDGVSITRTLATSTLSTIPTFGSNINVTYTTNAMATGNELPATVNNLTVNSTGANEIDLNKNLTVNGTLYLQSGLLDEVTFAVTIGAGGTLKIAAGDFEGTDSPTVTSYNLEYSGGGAVTSKASHLQSGSGITLLGLTVSQTGTVLTPHASLTVTNLTLNASTGGIALNTTTAVRNVTVTGNLTVTAGNFSTIALAGAVTAKPKVVLAGTAAQTFTVPSAGLTLQNGAEAVVDGDFIDIGDTPGIDAELNNTATTEAARTITLTGGNVTFGTGGSAIFTSGVLVTGANTLTLVQSNNPSTNQPVQGYARSVSGSNFSHVVGNIKKYINNSAGTSIDRSIVTFPVGTLPASPGSYRPMSIYFKTAPASAVNITVNHVNSRPGGNNGFPLNVTIGGQTVKITNYPNFFWYVKSDISLAPSYKFDMEAQAQGYTEYTGDQIQNVRLVRRDSGNVNNQWILQQDQATSTALYDNSTIAADWPVVKVIDATGGITGQGSLFTYSQNNKAPNFTAALGNVTRSEGDTLTFTYASSDPDIGDAATMSAVTLPTGATFNASTGAFSWAIGYDLATTATPSVTRTITIRTTDTFGPLSKDTTVTVTINNVNRAPSFTAAGGAKLANTTIKDGETLSFTYIAVDGDGDAVTYTTSLDTTTSPLPTINGTTGALTWTPTFLQAGKTYNVKVVATDAGGLQDSTTAAVTVNRARLKGDISGDGSVSSFDASKALQHTVGISVLTDTVDLWAGDVSGNGQVSAYDASLILQYVAQIITTFPSNAIVSGDADAASLSKSIYAGSIEWGTPEAAGSVVSIPVKLSDANEARALQFTLKVDAAVASIEGVSAKLPEDWQMLYKVSDGVITVAMAGVTPLASGDVATISLKMKDKEARLNLSGAGVVNEGKSSELSVANVGLVPTDYALQQNYPNPFNPSTTIKYQIPQDTRVDLVIYNLQGQKIRSLVSEEQKAGFYNVQWDGRNDAGQSVATGMYLYRVQAGSFVATHKMLLIK